MTRNKSARTHAEARLSIKITKCLLMFTALNPEPVSVRAFKTVRNTGPSQSAPYQLLLYGITAVLTPTLCVKTFSAITLTPCSTLSYPITKMLALKHPSACLLAFNFKISKRYLSVFCTQGYVVSDYDWHYMGKSLLKSSGDN